MSNTHQVPGSEPFPPEERRRKKRPFLVTLLAVLVLFISCINLIRLIEAIRTWDFLVSLPGVSPLYIALTGLNLDPGWIPSCLGNLARIP